MKKPIIGIVMQPDKMVYMNKELPLLYFFNDYSNSVIKSGGIPIAIIPTKPIDYEITKKEDMQPLTDEEKEDIITQINLCDGVIFQGGTRSFEYHYFIDTYLKENNIPTLAICLGMQIMAINSSKKTTVKIDTNENHLISNHEVFIKDKLLKNILGKDKTVVNSFHSYSVKDAGEYEVAAITRENVIEAISSDDYLFRLGLQWHPEKDYIDNLDSRKIFDSFIESAITYKKSR